MSDCCVIVEDMDECELEDIGQTCTGTCINTIGSFRCSEEDAASQEDGRDEEADEREAEAIQEVITSTQASTTTTTQTTTPVPTSTTVATTTSTMKSVDKMTTTTTTTTETPIPDEDEEKGEEESEPEEEERGEENRVIDNRIVDVVETKESGSEFDQTTCPDGFQLADRLAETEDGSACTDVDECESDNKFGCSHLCINTQGSAHCECPSGWKLNQDGKTCQGESDKN